MAHRKLSVGRYYLTYDSKSAIIGLRIRPHTDEEHGMYTVEFYENDRGVSELWDFLEELRMKSVSNKDARIQYKQIVLYIQLLQDNGTRLSENVTKHLTEDIWKLRPGNNRAFYFCWRGDRFVLLHQFRKKSQKTPRHEIECAKAERDDWFARKGE